MASFDLLGCRRHAVPSPRTAMKSKRCSPKGGGRFNDSLLGSTELRNLASNWTMLKNVMSSEIDETGPKTKLTQIVPKKIHVGIPYK